MDVLLNFTANTTPLKDADRLVKKVGTSTEQTAQKVSNLGKNMRLTKGPTSALSTTAGQLGVQFQDVAVQAEAGTDAVRIFSQQGPQILSVFGPTGAVFGAIAAIGVVVGKTLVDAFGMGGEAVVKFADSVEKVQKSVTDLTDGTYGLSESLVELAKTSDAAARLQIAIALDAADIAAKRASESFERLGLEGRGMFRELEDGSVATRDFAVALEDLRRGEQSAASLSVLKRAADGLGVSIEQIKGLSESYIEAIDPDAGASALVAFSEELGELAIKSSDPAFREFANNLIETAMEAQSTEERARLLSEAMTDLGVATRGTNQDTIDFVEKLEEQAAAIGKTREELLALQAAQIQDPALRARAEEAIKQIEFEAQAREEARRAEKAAAEARREELKKQREQERAAAEERRRIFNEDKELRAIEREQAKAAQQEQEEREKRIYEEQLRRTRQKFEEFKKQEEERKRIQETTTNALLAFEDKLLEGKSEKQKAAYRLAVNLADAEKRENARQIVSDSYSAAMKAYKALAGIPVIGPALGAAAAGVILAAGVTYAGKSLAGRALGGQVREGESYVVGERGPEVLTMGTGGRITPNDKLGGQSQTVNKVANITFEISTVDASGFDQLLQSRRGQIIGMINTAMNDQGRKALV